MSEIPLFCIILNRASVCMKKNIRLHIVFWWVPLIPMNHLLYMSVVWTLTLPFLPMGSWRSSRGSTHHSFFSPCILTSLHYTSITVRARGETPYRTHVVHEERSSGSFRFKNAGYAPEDKYYLSAKNPAFLIFGEGPTIVVTVEFSVSGYTTFL